MDPPSQLHWNPPAPGHRDMQMLPIEVISGKQPFLLQVREAYNIEKFGTEKRLGVREIEHGLNLSPGML